MRAFTAAMTAEVAKRMRVTPRIHLIDVQRGDGTQYFWSTFEGQFLSRLTGAQQLYKPWITQPPTIKMTRSLSADAGDFRIQNLSGNTIDREVGALFKAGEFEGAYVIYRPWLIPMDFAPFEFHGFLTEPNVQPQYVALRMRQLFAPNELPTYDLKQTRACGFRFTSPQCGYRRGQLFVPVTTATVFSANTIGAGSLALTPNLYKDESVLIVAGTGNGQERFILSHTATTFITKTNWTTNPDGTSKFLVTGPGTAKFGFFAGVTSATANSLTRTGTGRAVNQDVDAAIYILDGAGAGQNRSVISNTADTWTVSPNWAVIPNGTSAFQVVYRSCAKDRTSCVTRGVIERFPGIIFLQPQITAANGPTAVGTGGGTPRGGGGPIGRAPRLAQL